MQYSVGVKSMTRRKLERRNGHKVPTNRKAEPDRNLRNKPVGKSLKGSTEYRRVTIRYPQGANPMPVPTRRELMDRIKELESENEDLQTQIDEIADIVTPDEENDEGED